MGLPVGIAIAGMISSGVFLKFVGRMLLIGAGFTILEVVGLTVFFRQIEDFIRGQLSGLPSEIVGVMGLINIDLYINWMFLGVTVVIGLRPLRRIIPGL